MGLILRTAFWLWLAVHGAHFIHAAPKEPVEWFRSQEGDLTVWCAQHDEITSDPRPARSFELASLSGAESAGILRLLMSLQEPSQEVRRSVEAGVAWFKKAQLKGLRQARVDGDKVLVSDPSAPPIWARFYEIGSNRPIFAGRDAVKKYALPEIKPERRNGYAGYGSSGGAVMKNYSRWKSKVERGSQGD